MEYTNILTGSLTDNLCPFRDLLSDINEQNNLHELLFSMDEMSASTIVVDLRTNNNTPSRYESQSVYVINPDTHVPPLQEDKYAYGLTTKSLESTCEKQPKDIILQPLNLEKEHNLTKEELSGNISTNKFVADKKRKANSSASKSLKLRKKDEVCRIESQGSKESIYNKEELVYIMIQNDFKLNIPIENDQNKILPEAKCFYLTTLDYENYYYHIPEDPTLPSEKRFFNGLHLTIYNIPFNIELFIEATYIYDKNVIVNINYLDTQENKLFVYNRTFKIFYKKKQCPWHKLSVRVQKSESSTIIKKFIEPIYLQKYKFPIYDIPKLIALNTQVGANSAVWLKNEIIREINFSESMCVFVKDTYCPKSRAHLESTDSTTNSQKKDKHKNFVMLKEIISICDYKLWGISDPKSILYGKDVEANIKTFLNTVRNAIKFVGVGLIRTEQITEEQTELISLIAFINENVVNIVLKYLEKYDKLIGKRILFNEVFNIITFDEIQ